MIENTNMAMADIPALLNTVLKWCTATHHLNIYNFTFFNSLVQCKNYNMAASWQQQKCNSTGFQSHYYMQMSLIHLAQS